MDSDTIVVEIRAECVRGSNRSSNHGACGHRLRTEGSCGGSGDRRDLSVVDSPAGGIECVIALEAAHLPGGIAQAHASGGLLIEPAYGPVLANYGIDGLRFTKPVKPGDRIKVRLTCKEKSLRVGTDYGEVRWATEITNQSDETVAAYDVLTMVSEKVVPDGGAADVPPSPATGAKN